MRLPIVLGTLASLLVPLGARGQTAPPQPITLSPQEYQQLITEIASRDPVLGPLLKKQNEAQMAAAQAAQAAAQAAAAHPAAAATPTAPAAAPKP